MIKALLSAVSPDVARVRERRWISVMLMTVLIGVVGAGGPTAAGAAPYTVWACADGAGRSLPALDWKPVRSGAVGFLESTCGQASAESPRRLTAVADSNTHNRPELAGVGWSLDAPPDTNISGLDVWWAGGIRSYAFVLGRIQLSAPDAIYTLDPPSLERGIVFPSAYHAPRGAGSESAAFSDPYHHAYRGLSAQNVRFMALCVSACNVSTSTSGASYEVYRLRTTVEDSTPPTGSVDGLTDGARVHESTVLHVNTADVGGGVREISLRVDGRVVQRVGAEACAGVQPLDAESYEYRRMQPCPRGRVENLTLAPSDLADGGRHTVSVVASDAAGQETPIASARVALGAPTGFFGRTTGFINPDLDVLGSRRTNGVNAGAAGLQLAFPIGRKQHRRFVDRRVVGASARPLISGRLTSAVGIPISGARVWRSVAVTPGIWQISGEPLTTSATGEVSGRLPARSPNREVRLVYFPYSDSSENAQSQSRRLKVRAATTIRADQAGYRNGDTMRFSGRITTIPTERRKAVYLQAVVRGRWRTFDTTRANSRRRWTLRYRFTATRRLTIYRFRAVVPADDQPVSWATGYSRALRVLVAP